MTYVSTAELKSKLSQFLGQVREGQTVYVTSHGLPVAELIPYKGAQKLGIVPPSRPVSDLRKLRIGSQPPLNAEAILLEDRARR